MTRHAWCNREGECKCDRNKRQLGLSSSRVTSNSIRITVVTEEKRTQRLRLLMSIKKEKKEVLPAIIESEHSSDYETDDTDSKDDIMHSVKVPMPQFSGETGTLTRFLRNFEAWCTMVKITDDTRATVVGHCFKEGTMAAEWYEATYNPDTGNMEDYEEVKRLMLEWFDRVQTPGELTRLLEGLSQKKGETVDGFCDRVKRAMTHVTRELEWPPGLPKDDKPALRESVQQHFGKVFFLQGLQAGFRQLVCATEATTFQQYVDAARRTEGTAKDMKTGPAVMEADEMDEADELDATGPVRGRGRGAAGGWQTRGRGRTSFQRGRGAPRTSAPASRSATTPAGGGARSGKAFPVDMCARCGKSGHWRADCIVREENFAWGKNGHARRVDPKANELEDESYPDQEPDFL
jgi:hypothetical protein